MKNIGVSWLIWMHEHLSETPCNIVNGFLAANILQSVDAGITSRCLPSNSDEDDYSDDNGEEMTDEDHSSFEMDED